MFTPEAPGVYKLMVRAVDLAGNIGPAQTISICYEDNYPVANIVEPQEGRAVKGSVVDVWVWPIR